MVVTVESHFGFVALVLGCSRFVGSEAAATGASSDCLELIIEPLVAIAPIKSSTRPALG